MPFSGRALPYVMPQHICEIKASHASDNSQLPLALRLCFSFKRPGNPPKMETPENLWGAKPKGSATGARNLKSAQNGLERVQRSFGPRAQRSPKSLLHHQNSILHRCNSLLHSLLTTLGTFEVSGPCSRTSGSQLWGAKKYTKKLTRKQKVHRVVLGYWGEFVYVLSPPLRNDPKKTHKQMFATRLVPGQSRKTCLCLCAFLSQSLARIAKFPSLHHPRK